MKEGQYQVALPWRKFHEPLRNNYELYHVQLQDLRSKIPMCWQSMKRYFENSTHEELSKQWIQVILEWLVRSTTYCTMRSFDKTKKSSKFGRISTSLHNTGFMAFATAGGTCKQHALEEWSRSRTNPYRPTKQSCSRYICQSVAMQKLKLTLYICWLHH